jgi:hypothetical protein
VRGKDGRRERQEIRAASSVFLDPAFGYQLLPGSFAVEAFTGFAGLVLFCTALLEAVLAFFGFFMRNYVWAVLLTGFVLGFPLMTNESRSRWFEDLSVMRNVFAGELMRCGVVRGKPHESSVSKAEDDGRPTARQRTMK